MAQWVVESFSGAVCTQNGTALIECLRLLSQSSAGRPPRALRFGREIRTPAMQAGLVKRRLTLREIFVCARRPTGHLSSAELKVVDETSQRAR
jgi:hypothetical protein